MTTHTGKDNALGEMVQWVVDQAPGAAVFGLALLVAVGLVLWLLGSRLAKPAAVVSGVVMGAVVSAGLAGLLSGMGTLTIAFITLGGAILGGVLSGVLFRLWMGLSGALVLAAVVPAAVLVWQGTPGLEMPTAAPQASSGAGSSTPATPATPSASGGVSSLTGLGDATAALEDGSNASAWSEFLSRTLEPTTQPGAGKEGALNPEQLRTDLTGEQTREAIRQVSDQVKVAAKTVWLKNAEAVQRWWNGVTPQTQQVVYIGALAGGVLGLLVGLLLPTGSAMLQSSVVGSLLMLLPGRELVALKLPEYAGFLPGTPRQLVIALGLITAIGIGLQWMLRRRRAEK
ncbi:MAG: hypothetical protein AAF797_03670 [Planctomycetota bacterium]